MKSHILPRALTKTDGLSSNRGLLQVSDGQFGIAFSSWYDNKLVTADGEEILEKYDNWSISVLRRTRLVWSGWGPATVLTDSKFYHGSDGVGLRHIEGEDWCKLRLFFLSLLWRASASKRREFSAISIPDKDLETVRRMIVDGSPDPVEFYPVILTQISSRFENHNHAPMPDRLEFPNIKSTQNKIIVPTFRFYMDGLIAHFFRLSSEENANLEISPYYVGSDPHHLVVSTVTWENSRQRLMGIEALKEGVTNRLEQYLKPK